MDRNEIIDRAATPLDERLQVVSEGRVQACIALVVSLYFVDLPIDDARERVASVVELYADGAKDKLAWGSNPKTKRATKLEGSSTLDVRGWMRRLRVQDDFEPVFKGGKGLRDADPYTLMALSHGKAMAGYGGLFFSLPLEWAVGRPKGSFLALVLQACTALHALHGCAGFGLVVPPSEHGGGKPMGFAAPLAARFKGLEMGNPALDADEFGEANVIKGVNWLTVVGDSFVERLGGREALTRDLGDGIVVHPYESGVVIQAGSLPGFGDVNKGTRLTEYERVAAVLKPVRATKMEPLAWNHGFDEDRTAEWLARFDT
jgi:hypothetical protein